MGKCTNNRVCKFGVSDFSWRDICAEVVLGPIMKQDYNTSTRTCTPYSLKYSTE